MWRDPAEPASLSALSKHPSDFGMCDVAMSRAGLLGLEMCRDGVLLLLDLRLSFYLVLFYCAYTDYAVAGIAWLANERGGTGD
jgi:hypothetical protein